MSLLKNAFLQTYVAQVGIVKNGLLSRLIDGKAEVICRDIMCDSVGPIPFCSPRYKLISPSDLMRAFITSLFLHLIIIRCQLQYCHQPLFRGRAINVCITILVGKFAQLVRTLLCRLVTFLSSFLSYSSHTLDEACVVSAFLLHIQCFHVI